MSGMDDVLQRLVAQVGTGTDAWIDGPPAAARSLLLRAERSLAEQFAIVSVSAPVGELNLSGLIAQLSGQADLDGQDDAVLERCFKRLVGAERTVLLLWPPHGIGRSALRYLQHVCREVPGLVTAVLGSAPLDATLAEPGFEGLRQRWQAAPAIELAPVADAAPAAPLSIVPLSTAPLSTPPLPAAPLPTARMPLVPVPARPIAAASPTLPVPIVPAPASLSRLTPGRRRRPVVWAVSALGAAAVVGFVWFAHGAPGGADPRVAASGVPMEGALVPLPPLAAGSAPAAVAAPAPVMGSAGLPAVGSAGLPAVGSAGLPAVGSAGLPALAEPPPSLPHLAAAPLVAAPPAAPLAAALPEATASRPSPPTVQAERLPALRRPEPVRRAPAPTRFARARPYEPSPYEAMQPYDEPPPVWARPVPGPREMPYLGTYVVGPGGIRIFRYDP